VKTKLDKEMRQKQNKEKQKRKRKILTFFGIWEMGCPYLSPSMKEFLQSKFPIANGGPFC
jgi:hypothetical protein